MDYLTQHEGKTLVMRYQIQVEIKIQIRPGSIGVGSAIVEATRHLESPGILPETLSFSIE